MLNFRNLFFLLLLSVMLSACGFQLRGDYQLVDRLGKTELRFTDEYSDFSRKLKRTLQRAGVELINSGSSDSIIVVSKSDFSREVLSIGNDARVREFRLNLEMEFSVLAGADKETSNETVIRLKPQLLKQQRDLRFDADRVLATSREAEFLEEDMSNALVRQFMQRLSQLDLLEKL